MAATSCKGVLAVTRQFAALALSVLLVVGFATSDARAGVRVSTNLSTQTMTVSVNGRVKHRWPVSSGKKGYTTPTGTYRPGRMYREYYSRKYDGSPMPHSIFFRGGYAIHGTGYTRSLGRRASHGCIRLHPSNARALYDLIRAHGKSNTRISIFY